MTNNKLFLLIGTSMSLIPQTINAQCVATQDCATLGYTETSCSGGSGVKCPFGNKWACFKTDAEVCQKYGFTNVCSGTGQVGKGESCANLYKQCDCQSTYKYACSGTGYSGGSGSACNGKYTKCTCASGYEWKDGSCQKQVLNGAQGDLYYCNGTVVGVKTSDMDFYVAMKDVGMITWADANSRCSSYSFCGNVKGTLPNKDQLLSIYNNKSAVTSLLSTNGGTKMTENWYWSSTCIRDRFGNCAYYIVSVSGGDVYYDTTYGDNHYARPVLTSW